MIGFALGRVAGLIPTLFALVTVSFFVIRLAPGGPFDQEQSLPPAIKRNLESFYGLDQPLGVQYVRYIGGLARGDFGPSLRFQDSTVGEMIAQGLPASLVLGFIAVLLALAVGVPLGAAAALRQNQWTDHLVMGVAVLGIALPGFVIGPFLQLVFAVWLRWLPVSGWDDSGARHLVLPAITLALPVIAYVARLMRGSLLEVLQAPYIRTARAKGLGEARVLWRHALRPAMLPIVSYLAPAVAFIVTGSLVVETIFGVPGTGRFLVLAAINRDYPLVMGMVVVYGTLTLLCNLAADLLYGWLDPRVRHG